MTVEFGSAKLQVLSEAFRLILWSFASAKLQGLNERSEQMTVEFGSAKLRETSARRARDSGRRTQVAKGEVCKTSIHRFESGRRL
jgi:hypothetical protein